LSAWAPRAIAGDHRARSRWVEGAEVALLAGAALALGALMWLFGPTPSILGWLVVAGGGAAILAQPRIGLYLILFLALVSDGVLVPWFPFLKNLSSAESLLYLGDALIFSPLELYLGLTLLSWGARFFARRQVRVRAGALGLPVLFFALSIGGGLAYGLAMGGDLNTALWEARPIFYLPLIYLLTVNLIETRSHVSALVWAAMIALLVEGIAGILYFGLELEGDLGAVQAITEHSAAIHMNTLFCLILGAWLFGGSPAKRWVLPLFAPVVGLTYLATQRRAAFVALAIALALIALVLYRENRRLFWWVAPPAALIGALYLALFWNSSGALGLPARGLRSVFAGEDSAEYSSNIYRVIENINIGFTIHQEPLLGVGFGRKFYILAPLPDLSFFEWWEYITHNSVLWIWMKAGVGGFLALLYLIGSAVAHGAQTVRGLKKGDLKAVALTMLLYVIMHFVYAYVDMSWDAQSMLYLGAAMGLLAGMDRIAARPAPQRPPRWSWQKAGGRGR